MTITSQWQAEIRSLVQGVGTAYGINGVKGLGTPTLRTGDVPLARNSGVRAQEDYYGGRLLEITFRIVDTSGSIEATLDAWKQAWRISTSDDITLDLRTTGGAARRYFGRPRRLKVDESSMQFGFVEATAQFLATDYRAYSLTESSLTLTLGTVTGGMTFPMTFPLTFGSGSSGQETAANEGNIETYPALQINGPLTTPSVENLTTGQVFTYDGTLSSSEFITVDLQDRTVLLGGTASRYSNAVGSDWWALDPGDNNLRLNAASGSGDCDVTWRSAWL